VWEIADFYTKEFQNDLKKLNILFPDIWCKATDHIKEQIEFIQKLEKRGYAYAAGGNVYFDTAKVKEYGKLALLDLTKEKKARVEKDPHKKNQHDFVLWFTKSKFLEQEMKWDSPWGKGYPGWHIECSAMSIKYLGETIDIHCGGIDHIPTHHTNEIAQSEAATGKKFVNFWMHGEFLVLEEKMSKSKGNMITLSTIEEKGFSPLDYRYFCLNAHYKKPLKFSWEGLDAAKNARERIKEKVLEIRKIISPSNASTSKRYKEQFIAAINDDLNMPEALAVLWFALKDRTVSAKDLLALIEEFDKIFGLDLLKEEKTKIPKETIALAEEREKYRKQKNFSKADEIRKELSKKGYVIEDNDAGYKIKKIK
ncbi:MAG: cysteine--tRNA ligase, partial [Nanoarchaeota archaeon]